MGAKLPERLERKMVVGRNSHRIDNSDCLVHFGNIAERIGALELVQARININGVTYRKCTCSAALENPHLSRVIVYSGKTAEDVP